MIDITRKEKIITVKVTGKYPVNGWSWSFALSFDNESHAILVQENLAQNMYDKLEAIRKEAYEQGWKDAKSKKPKQDWFNCCWEK